MSAPDLTSEPAGPPACKLDSAGLGAQLRRYQRLARHASSVQRLPGKLIVHFEGVLPPGLLEHTLEVERRCCRFVHTSYAPSEQRLSMTVANLDQDPRLDSLFQALKPVGECCAPEILTSCCEPQSKDRCCGSPATSPPPACGCRSDL